MNGHRVPAIGLGVGALMTLGCVISDNPWFAKKDIAFDMKLLGSWAAVGDNEVILFAEGPDDSYVIKGEGAKAKDEMPAHLVKIGGAKYLDVLVKGNEGGREKSGHLLMRLDLAGDDLTLTHMDAQWLAGAIEGKNVDVRGGIESKPGEKDPEVHLTGPTEELQALVAKHGEDLFKGGKTLKYARKK